MIKGEISCDSKEDAIHMIIGLMETFDITLKELEY